MSYYPPFPAGDVWSYPTRTLTQRFGIIERARGYSSGFSRIYDEARFINAVLYLLGSGRGAIAVIPDDDIAYNKTWTVITAPETGTAPDCVTDHNDSTYCSWTISASSLVDLLRVDLGASMTGVLRILQYYSSSAFYTKVNVSNDGSTWTEIYSESASGVIKEIFVYINGYRYIKFSFQNTFTSALTGNIYSIEFYPDTVLPISKAFNNIGKRIAVFVNNSYYQLLEVISL